ncbi:hypothetical protein T459_30719 [Capsicum annuum]|uniref:Uncharacterized protein n=1 Tax=Capsicum annuum TaxID=4072 RepID=A0A2G2Y997_CAPAN|nr:hypothetical protein T459_30719 [Capsicum annuum]
MGKISGISDVAIHGRFPLQEISYRKETLNRKRQPKPPEVVSLEQFPAGSSPDLISNGQNNVGSASTVVEDHNHAGRQLRISCEIDMDHGKYPITPINDLKSLLKNSWFGHLARRATIAPRHWKMTTGNVAGSLTQWNCVVILDGTWKLGAMRYNYIALLEIDNCVLGP